MFKKLTFIAVLFCFLLSALNAFAIMVTKSGEQCLVLNGCIYSEDEIDCGCMGLLGGTSTCTGYCAPDLAMVDCECAWWPDKSDYVSCNNGCLGVVEWNDGSGWDEVWFWSIGGDADADADADADGDGDGDPS